MGAGPNATTRGAQSWVGSCLPFQGLGHIPSPTPHTFFPVQILSPTDSTTLSSLWLLRLSIIQKSVVNKMLVIIK